MKMIQISFNDWYFIQQLKIFHSATDISFNDWKLFQLKNFIQHLKIIISVNSWIIQSTNKFS